MSNDPSMYWFSELCRVIKRQPHPAYPCVSIASSSPMSLWYCPQCHQTQYGLRKCQPHCQGGFRNRWQREFDTRMENLSDITFRVGRYAKERGTESALSWHRKWLSDQTFSKNGNGPDV